MFCLLGCWQLAHADTLSYELMGLEGDVLDNVQTRLDIANSALGAAPSAEDIQQFYQQATDNILEAMQPYGYYQPTISPQLQQNGDQWQATFSIQPGTEIRIHHISVGIVGPGKHDPEFLDLLKNFPLKEGNILLTEEYNQAKKALFDIAEHRGYMAAQLLQHEIRIDLKQYTADIILHFDSGEQFYFGAINFSKTPFSEHFLRRFIRFQPNSPYSTQDILRLQDDLARSGYFQQVNIDAVIDNAEDQQIPIDIHLEPRRLQGYALGAGYGTDTGIRGTVAWELRRLNANGHRLQLFAQGSPIQNTLQAQYLIPGQRPAYDQYSLGASLFNLDLPNSSSRAALLTAAAITEHNRWRRIVSINALYERFRNLGFSTQKSFILYPQFNWQIINADSLTFPSAGYRLAISVLGGAKSVLSDIDFAQASLEAKGIYTLFNNTRLIARGSFGYTAINDILQLPTSLQFFTGGSESVRGYSYLSLGPGKILVTASGEIQQRVFGKWYLAAFYDAGNAIDTFPLLLQQSIGAGIIRETLIGPVRLYLAKALSVEGKPTRVVFSLGPDFI